MTIAWKSDLPPEACPTLDVFLGKCRELALESSRESGIAAILQHNSGAEMTAAVAGEQWWFVWVPSDYAVHGTGSFHSSCLPEELPPPQPHDLIPYFLFGHHGELDLRILVDSSTGLATLKQFYASAGRPDTVSWLPD